MDLHEQAELARQQLRNSIMLVLRREAAEAPGDRNAAIARVRDEFLKELARADLPEESQTPEDRVWRKALAAEVEKAVAEILREFAGRC